MNSREPGQLCFLEIVEGILRDGHSVRFRASGWSMHPTIRNGEIITVAPLGQLPIQTGEIVLYRRDRATIAHRVVRVQSTADGSSELIVRGDAADCCDRPTPIGQVIGRVLAVERNQALVRLDLVHPHWSRAVALVIRRVHDARLKIRALLPRRESRARGIFSR
jgi:signal peptidase I